jgi:hypothetical protein
MVFSDSLLAETKKMLIDGQLNDKLNSETAEAIYSILTFIYGVEWDS